MGKIMVYLSTAYYVENKGSVSPVRAHLESQIVVAMQDIPAPLSLFPLHFPFVAIPFNFSVFSPLMAVLLNVGILFCWKI